MQIATKPHNYPTDPKTGLTLPLTTFLGSQAIADHRATVAFELEVLCKKLDRFGWEKERGTAAQDRIITDWMDALQDYPLQEVQAACREWIETGTARAPTEGQIKALIMHGRRMFLQLNRKPIQIEDTSQRRGK